MNVIPNFSKKLTGENLLRSMRLSETSFDLESIVKVWQAIEWDGVPIIYFYVRIDGMPQL